MNNSSSVDINGNKIRLVREQKGLTQLYLATVVGVTTDTISRWENRRYPSIKLDNARKLAEALEVSLDELLENEGQGAVPDVPENVEQVMADESSPPVPTGIFRYFGLHRRNVIATCGGLLTVTALVAIVLLVNRSGINAVRIMPTHTAPNSPFPVLVQVTGEIETMNTLLIREELQGDCGAIGASADGPPKQFGKNPRWIGKLTNGKAAFLYLVEPGKKLRAEEEIRISGDLISREGQSAGDAIGGSERVVVAPYHWADSDKDYVISDSEIRKAYETYSLPGENLVNFTAIEELWMAGRYAWNKKSQVFVPSPLADGKE
ncbi:helix-turn-helix transcriptional regulator [uncultured Desulfobulbus sp.]|uniref:helix-turn-helix transcriptional regulator n=1 Tax=uncultured Desulfobulbus sp. TaxID=239745 RepID=UPI0029C67D91|nr:helix-turn-helix transcriptional regulator [uncultured Desulfobulbus sp.]